MPDSPNEPACGSQVDRWPEREELLRWLVEAVARQATYQPAVFRLVTSDGVKWVAEAVQDEDRVVRVRMYWESSDEPARRIHEWDAEIVASKVHWPFEE